MTPEENLKRRVYLGVSYSLLVDWDFIVEAASYSMVNNEWFKEVVWC